MDHATRIKAATLLLATQIASGAGAVEMDRDARVLDPGGPQAVGHVSCGSGSGSGQLVGSQRVLVTAAHVLLGPEGRRAEICHFHLRIGGRTVALEIDMDRVLAGAARPQGAPAAQDWAVAQLRQAASGVRPLTLGAPGRGGVRLVSGRTLLSAGAATVEPCAIIGFRQDGGGREALIDCSAQAGDSGAALLGPDGRLVGVYVGYRSTAPGLRQPASAAHYNFAVVPPAALGRAVAQLAR